MIFYPYEPQSPFLPGLFVVFISITCTLFLPSSKSRRLTLNTHVVTLPQVFHPLGVWSSTLLASFCQRGQLKLDTVPNSHKYTDVRRNTSSYMHTSSTSAQSNDTSDHLKEKWTVWICYPMMSLLSGIFRFFLAFPKPPVVISAGTTERMSHENQFCCQYAIHADWNVEDKDQVFSPSELWQCPCFDQYSTQPACSSRCGQGWPPFSRSCRTVLLRLRTVALQGSAQPDHPVHSLTTQDTAEVQKDIQLRNNQHHITATFSLKKYHPIVLCWRWCV